MKKRGFTLIELLAVIVILAIIALIATPIVLNLINEARRGAFKKSAEGVLKSAKLEYSKSLLSENSPVSIIYNCDNNKCISNNNKELDVSGNVGEGEVHIENDGSISFSLTNNEYCAVKYFESNEIHMYKGTCESNDIDLINDTTPPVIKKVNNIITTNSITLTIVAEEDKVIKGYSCKMDDGEFTKIENSAVCKFDKLEPNQTHTFVVRVYNKLPNSDNYESSKNMVESEPFELKTTLLPTPVIEVENYTTWTQSKKVNIYYNGKDESIDMTGVTSTYSIEKDGIEIDSGTDSEITVTDNVMVTAINRDSNNNNTSTTAIIDTIDTSEPIIDRINKAETSRNIVLTITARDEESDIENVKCYYGNNYETEVLATKGNDNGYSCAFSNTLTPGTEYNYKVVATNGAGITKEEEGTSVTASFGNITLTSNPGLEEWSSSKTITLSGTTPGARIQYTLGDSTDFIDYTEPFVVDENTSINVRFYDGNTASNVVSHVVDTIYIPASSIQYRDTNVQADIESLYNQLKDL